MDEDELQRAIDNVKLKYQIDFTLKKEQRQIIEHILNKKDVFGLLPTGFGKSMTFILVPLILNELAPDRNHCALVVSPLKALMKDQVVYLKQKDIQATAICDDVTVKDIDAGSCVIFISPEAGVMPKWQKLLKNKFQEMICLLVFDEAHCISSWGLEFRPTYRQIPVLQSFFDVPNLSLTATATTKIQKDVYDVLGLQPEATKLVAVLPNRSNIFLHVIQSSEKYEVELKWIVDHLTEGNKKIILYVRSINLCYQIYLFFLSNLMENVFINKEPSAKNRRVEMFHANTDPESKDRILEEFTKQNSRIRILISTVAFGMGINITDIDIVVHWGLPSSPLSYWQEIGRCARDGRRGYAICYAYKRSISKLKDEDKYKEMTNVDSCLRVAILKFFLLDGMDEKELNDLEVKEECRNACDNCRCKKCCCCIVCLKKCKCCSDDVEPLLSFLK